MPYQKVDYAIIAGLLRLGDEGNRRLSVYQSARISGTPFNIPRGSLVGQSDRRPCTSIYSTVVDTTWYSLVLQESDHKIENDF